MPTDKVSVWRETRKKVDGNYYIEDWAAGKEETPTRSLNVLPPEEKNYPEVRDIIFVENFDPPAGRLEKLQLQSKWEAANFAIREIVEIFTRCANSRYFNWYRDNNVETKGSILHYDYD
ncbi:hypothetical protein LguiA_011875 [Lonicera macranthoides]